MTVWGIIHSTAALIMIACIAVPFIAARLKNKPADAAGKSAQKLAKWLRIPHFVLIISLITGLIQSGFAFSSWLLMVLVIFLAIAALLGIVTKTLKTIQAQAEKQEEVRPAVGKVVRLSAIMSLLIVAMVVIKVM